MNFRIDESQILLSLTKGECINQTIESFAAVKGVGCAWLNGIGAIENPIIGYYSVENKSKWTAGDDENYFYDLKEQK